MRISQIPSLPYFCKLFRASKYPYADHVSNARTRKFPSGILYSKDSGAFIQLLMLGFTALIYVQLMFFFTVFFSQVLPHDELMENKRSHRQSHRKKVLPEIYLTRLLSTKVTIVKRPKAKTKHKSSLCSIFYYLYLFQKPHRNSFVA